MGGISENHPYITGIEFKGLTKADLSEPLDYDHVDRQIIGKTINSNLSSQSFSCTIKLKQYTRKKFKKYLMAHGYSRDDAEKACKTVAKYKGKISYTGYLIWNVIFGEPCA